MKEQEKERVQQLTEAIDAAELFVRRAKAARQALKLALETRIGAWSSRR